MKDMQAFYTSHKSLQNAVRQVATSMTRYNLGVKECLPSNCFIHHASVGLKWDQDQYDNLPLKSLKLRISSGYAQDVPNGTQKLEVVIIDAVVTDYGGWFVQLPENLCKLKSRKLMFRQQLTFEISALPEGVEEIDAWFLDDAQYGNLQFKQKLPCTTVRIIKANTLRNLRNAQEPFPNLAELFPNLTTLHFKNFSEQLCEKFFPKSLVDLRIDYAPLNFEIDPNHLPPNLKKLKLPSNACILPNYLPSSLTDLHIDFATMFHKEHKYKYQPHPRPKVNLPTSIRHLVIEKKRDLAHIKTGQRVARLSRISVQNSAVNISDFITRDGLCLQTLVLFHVDVDLGIFPEAVVNSIRHLKIHVKTAQSINGEFKKFKSLKALCVPDHMDKDDCLKSLPKRLEFLEAAFTCQITKELLPKCLKYLFLPWYNKPLRNGMLPPSLVVLKMPHYVHSFCCDFCFPKSLQYLDLSYKIIYDCLDAQLFQHKTTMSFDRFVEIAKSQ